MVRAPHVPLPDFTRPCEHIAGTHGMLRSIRYKEEGFRGDMVLSILLPHCRHHCQLYLLTHHRSVGQRDCGSKWLEGREKSTDVHHSLRLSRSYLRFAPLPSLHAWLAELEEGEFTVLAAEKLGHSGCCLLHSDGRLRQLLLLPKRRSLVALLRGPLCRL